MYPEIEVFGKEISTMYIVYSIGGFIAATCFVLKRRKYGYSLKKSMVYALFLISVGMVELRAMGAIRTFLLSVVSDGEFTPSVSVRIFGAILFQPIICLIVSGITGDNYRKMLDSFAPETFMYFVFGKISCALEGCCHGIPYIGGVYSPKIEQMVFPVQFCEALSSVLIVIALYILALRKKRIRDGALFPLGALVYSIFRFIWENLRYYESHWESDFFFGMTFWQMWCVLTIIISLACLGYLYSKPQYAECDYKQNKFVATEFLIEKYNKFKHRNDKNIIHHKKKRK